MNDSKINKDIYNIFYSIKKNKILFLVVVLFMLAFTVIYLKYIAVKYWEAKQVIEYKGNITTQDFSGLAILGDLAGQSNSNASIELNRMKSDVVLKKVVDELNIIDFLNNHLSLYQKLLKVKYSERSAINYLKDKIQFFPSKENSNIIEIKIRTMDPTYAASIIALTYKYYKEYTKSIDLENTENYIAQLEKNFIQISKELDGINKEIIEFQAKNKITDDTLNKYLLDYYMNIYTNLLSLEKQKTEYELKKSNIENNINNMDSDLRELLVFNSNSQLRSLKSQIINLSIELETTKLLSPQSPKVVELEATLKALNKEYNDLLQQSLNQNQLAFLASIDEDLYKEYTTVIASLDNLDTLKATYMGILNRIDEEINKSTGPIYEYLKLKKDQKILELKYQMYLSNLENEKLKLATYKDKFIVIDEVYIPQSSVAPNKKMGLAIGFIFSIFFAVFIVNLKETLNTKIDDIYKLKEVYGTPDFIINNTEEFSKIAIYAKLNNKRKIGILFSNSTKYLKEEISEILFFYNFSIITAHKDNIVEHFDKFKNNDDYQVILMENVNSFEYTLFKGYLDELYIVANKYEISIFNEILNKNKNVKVIYIKG
jgi:uncharacterized protein involved in exopolysaccharide biosynthesis